MLEWTRSYQDDAFWYITRSYERSSWELEQNKNKFCFWPPRLHIFRITRGYLLHSLIFPHSLLIFKDFGTKIMNTVFFVKIFIFQKWVLFPIWPGSSYIFNLQPLGIELSTNFVYQTNNNHWATGWLLTWHNNLKQFWKHWTGAAPLTNNMSGCLDLLGFTLQMLL